MPQATTMGRCLPALDHFIALPHDALYSRQIGAVAENAHAVEEFTVTH
jgi:hypothetical protein